MTGLRVLRIYHAGRDAAQLEREAALIRAGIDVTLVIPDAWPGSPLDDVAASAPCPIVALPVRRPGDVNRHSYREPRRIAALLDELRPDIVDVHEEPFSSVMHQVLGLMPRDRTVVAYAAQNLDKRFPPPFAQYERQALRRLQGIYPCSRQAASVVVGKGFDGALAVLPLPPHPSITPGEQSLADPELRLVIAGRLVPEKGVRAAVHALAEVRRHRRARLMIVGTGPEAGPARSLAADLGVADAVDIVDWVSAAEMAAIYRAAHVVMVPSTATSTWVEQFGRVVVEANAAGAPVVAYASGSLPEVVGDAGVLVPEGDQEELARASVELVSSSQRWSALRDAGLARARECTWDAVARGQVTLYEQALAYRHDRRPLRPHRYEAVELYGHPARTTGADRPFAVPLLREDTPVSRAAAGALDRLGRKEAGSAERRPLRVVYVDHTAQLSGGELALTRLLEALPDVEPYVLLAEDGPLVELLRARSVPTEVIALSPSARDVRRGEATLRIGSLGGVLHAAAYTFQLTRRLRQLKADLVHTNSLKAGYYGSAAAYLARTPVLWHVRDRIAPDYLPRTAVWTTRAALGLWPTAIVCNSRATQATIGAHARPSTVIGSPVHPDMQDAQREDRHGRRDEPLVIGMVGRIARWKGQHVAISALAHGFPNGGAELRLIGDALFDEAPYLDELKRQVADLALDDRVHFLGFRDDVAQQLRELDVLVHASTTPEPFGQVIVEGMAAGLPVVASRAGGPIEIIDGDVDGVLVPAGDDLALAAALRELADDPEKRSRLGAAAAVSAHRYDAPTVGRAMRRLYDDTLEVGKRDATSRAHRHAELPTLHLNALSLRPDGAGVATYIRELLAALPPPVRNQVAVLVQSDALDDVPAGFGLRAAPPHSGARRALTGMLSGSPTAMHGLDVDLPLKASGPLLSTVHDLSVFDVPWTFSAARARGEQLLVTHALKRADHVFAVSSFTAERVWSRFRRECTVTPLAAPSDMRPPTDEQVRDARETYALPNSYVLAVGSLEPRKGLVRLASITRELGVPLVVVGHALTSEAPAGKGVHYLGYVPRSVLPALYAGATVVAYASTYEGFGLPPVEALACGAAVVSTAVGDLRSLLPDAAVWASPHATASLRTALRSVLTDEDLRTELTANAVERVSALSWSATASTTAEVWARYGCIRLAHERV
ncbi:glycosyltransferase [Humibacter sp.]|uniref:glycosyltransferase n=1 Tax=Humibacter sp. TaxID=1940291 RepID=UPI002BDCA632|nr:glycosyltransferase [Humibacter sp.]HVX07912.1 glycosyltransferase [Humibacter sp.]